MKIVHLVDYFQPKIGYQEYFLARYHQKFGHQITVVTSDRFYPFPNFRETFTKILGKRFVGCGTFQEEGITTIRLKSLEIPGTPLIMLENLNSTIRKIMPDLVICHGVYSFTSLMIALIKNELDFKLVYDNHAAPFNTDFNAGFLKRFYHFIHSVFFKSRIMTASDRIFAIGSQEKEFICRDFKLQAKEIPVIRLGVDTLRFTNNKKQRLSIRNRLGIKSTDKVIIYCGKIAHNKDIHYLVKALLLLSVPTLKLLIVGGGDDQYLDSIKRNLQGKLDLIHLDYVANSDLSNFLSAADIGVWPGNPSNTMLEALSCGLPLILPKMDETDYLRQSGAVFWFTRGRSEELSQQLQKLIKNSKLRNFMSQKASLYVKKHLAWDIIAKQVLALVD